MNTIKSGDFTGFSNTSMNEALQNALEKAGDPPRFSVVETFGVHITEQEKQYQVVVKPKHSVSKKSHRPKAEGLIFKSSKSSRSLLPEES